MSDQQTPTLTKEDLAFFIKTIWGSLLTPNWTRDGLIELGKAVFSKIGLDVMDDKKFAQLLPYLTTMAEKMASSLSVQIDQVTRPLIDTLKEVGDKNQSLMARVEELEKTIQSLTSQLEKSPQKEVSVPTE